MRVLFKANGECLLEGKETIRLGDMLCELLNYDSDYFRQAEERLLPELEPFDYFYWEDLDVEKCKSIIEKADSVVEMFEKEIKSYIFFRHFNDVDALFGKLRKDAREIKRFLDVCSDCGEETIRLDDPDIVDDFDEYEFRKFFDTLKEVTGLYSLLVVTRDSFWPLAESCMLTGQPLENIAAFDLSAFNHSVLTLVRNARLTPLSSLAVLYELDENGELVQVYDFGTLPQYIYHEIMQLILANRGIRKCKHCGRYFSPQNNRPIEYCDSIAPGQTKPCYAVGPMSTYTDKVKADPILEIYTRLYKRYTARRRTGSITPQEFVQWADMAKTKRDRAYKEGVSPEEFEKSIDFGFLFD